MVQNDGASFITKNGKPVAELMPCDRRPRGRSTMVGIWELRARFGKYLRKAREKSDVSLSRHGAVVTKLIDP